MSNENVKEKDLVEEQLENKSKDLYSLILFNDEINTFDFVINALISVCSHSSEQAEQCTMIAHFNGSCDVKRGELEKLKPLKDKLSNKGIISIIQ